MAPLPQPYLKKCCCGKPHEPSTRYGHTQTKFLPRPEVGNLSYRLLQRARAEAKKEEWLSRILAEKPGRIPQVFLGPIAAGEKVVASTRAAIYRFLQSQYSDTLALEMEGFGFLRAVQLGNSVEALLVRGISDTIDGKADADASGSQSIASTNASAFVFEVLSKLLIENREQGALRRASKIRRKLLYELRLTGNKQQDGITLYGWRFLEAPHISELETSADTIITGNPSSTTFHLAPGIPIRNCSVECELQIVDPGTDSNNWAGIRVRGFHDNITQGYLVYLRDTGTLELHRGDKIIGGLGKVVSAKPREEWTKVRIDVFEQKIKVWCNGKLHIQRNDRAFGEEGRIYLHAFGSRARFRNFRVYKLDG